MYQSLNAIHIDDPNKHGKFFELIYYFYYCVIMIYNDMMASINIKIYNIDCRSCYPWFYGTKGVNMSKICYLLYRQ